MQGPRIAFLAVRRVQRKGECIFPLFPASPYPVAVSDTAPVQMIFTVVAGKRIGFTVQGKSAFADPVCPSADNCPAISGILLVTVYVIIAAHDVAHDTVSVRNTQGLNGCAVIKHRHAHPVPIPDGAGKDRFTERGMTE